jgi:lipopolysaccharide export system permease protein
VRKLDKYILKNYLQWFFLALLGCWGIFIIASLFDLMDKMLQNNVTLKDVFIFYLYKSPFIIVQILPLSLLMAVMFCFGILGKNSELVAMRSSGISFWRIISPVLIFAALMSGFLFFLNDYVAPYTEAKGIWIERYVIKGRVPHSNQQRNNIYLRGTNERFYKMRFYHIGPMRMDSLVFTELDRDSGTVKRRIDAREAYWRDDHWELRSGQIYKFELLKESENNTGRNEEISAEIISNPFPESKNDVLLLDSMEYFDKMDLYVDEGPEAFANIPKKPEEMSYGELSDYIKFLENAGLDSSRLKVDLMIKVSFPLACFILVLIGAPMVVGGHRSGSLILGFGIGIAIALLYYGITAICQTLGQGVMPAFIAAWLPNAVFLVVGIFVCFRASR